MAEKAEVERTSIEKPEVDISDENFLAHDARFSAFTPAEQRHIIWRIDRRLVLTLGFLYMISLMDRTNLGAASIAG